MNLVYGALLAGFVHVLSGPDHLAAIAPVAVLRRRAAWRVGLRWGLGHTGGVMVVGAVSVLLRGWLDPERFSAFGERAVGLALVAIGIWGIRAVRRIPDTWFGESDNASAHPHRPAGHAAFGFGLLHGVAGGAHLLGVLPALALPSAALGGAWLALFGLGTVVAMTGFAAAVGAVSHRLGAGAARTYRGILGACAVGAIVIGGWWIVVGGI